VDSWDSIIFNWICNWLSTIHNTLHDKFLWSLIMWINFYLKKHLTYYCALFLLFRLQKIQELCSWCHSHWCLHSLMIHFEIAHSMYILKIHLICMHITMENICKYYFNTWKTLEVYKEITSSKRVDCTYCDLILWKPWSKKIYQLS